MATITSLSSIGTIDPANDVLVIVDVSLNTTFKVTPNALNGITGAVVGTTDTQVLTNKTVGITNTISALDSTFSIVDNIDNTKVAQFQVSGITTGTTRTYTLPNVSDTLAALTATQTFTNKTLTAPAISGGSIDNSTITVDSISGHTTSTIVTVGGVQMNNGIVATAGAVNTNSIGAGAVVPNSLFASTGTGWAWQAYVPTLTNITLGTGGQINSARYIQIGKTVFYRGFIELGATGAMGTSPTISLPVAASSSADYTTGVQSVGTLILFDSAVTQYPGLIYMGSGNLQLYAQNAAGTYLVGGSSYPVTATVPFSWGAADGIVWNVMYEAA